MCDDEISIILVYSRLYYFPYTADWTMLEKVPGRSRDGMGVPDPRCGTGWDSVSWALSFSMEGEASLLHVPLVWLCVELCYSIYQINFSKDLENTDITQFQWRKISVLCERSLGTVDVALSSKVSLKFLHFCCLHTYIYVIVNTSVRHTYVRKSISELQIQAATYVFELSAGNCHR
jgi:hypothetical protein